MRALIDLTGRKFGRLRVIKRTENNKNEPQWLCQCDCGKAIITRGWSLRSGHTQSCGCQHIDKAREANKTHGDYRKRLYHIWIAMLSRCESKGLKSTRLTRNYRDRGIRVCPEWHDYETFKVWAMANGYADNLSIDRIDNNGNYEPSNCRWATYNEQNYNRRCNVYLTYDGKTMTTKQWAKYLGIKYNTLVGRLTTKKWPVEKALSTPVEVKYASGSR
jgi:hypothetical protein